MKKSVSIIGGGPAAMMLAAKLDTEKYNVSVYEKNKALGRKFLVAGKGGFNLTHGEELEVFVGRYHPNYFLKQAVTDFSNIDLQKWLKELGIETYAGTSNRIFPVKGTKPVEVLNAILSQMENNKVNIYTGYKWIGFANDNSLMFESKNQIKNVDSDIVVFALGGASWKITGSDGTWLDYFMKRGITCLPFEASNCGYKVNWPSIILDKIEGKALKNCQFKSGLTFHAGEAVITSLGIEGSGVYPLGYEIRKQLSEKNKAELLIDLKPQNTLEEISLKLANRKNVSLTRYLEKDMNLGGTKTLLLKAILSKENFTDNNSLAVKIKNLPLEISGLAPIDEAISTVGGVSLKEIDDHYQLKKIPNHFVIGEMLDWDAPTGGYLLQACFSMGNNLAHYLNKN